MLELVLQFNLHARASAARRWYKQIQCSFRSSSPQTIWYALKDLARSAFRRRYRHVMAVASLSSRWLAWRKRANAHRKLCASTLYFRHARVMQGFWWCLWFRTREGAACTHARWPTLCGLWHRNQLVPMYNESDYPINRQLCSVQSMWAHVHGQESFSSFSHERVLISELTI